MSTLYPILTKLWGKQYLGGGHFEVGLLKQITQGWQLITRLKYDQQSEIYQKQQ